MAVKVFYSVEDEEWQAIDKARPGLCAWGGTADAALRELKDAQKVWDQAHCRVSFKVSGDR